MPAYARDLPFARPPGLQELDRLAAEDAARRAMAEIEPVARDEAAVTTAHAEIGWLAGTLIYLAGVSCGALAAAAALSII